MSRARYRVIGQRMIEISRTRGCFMGWITSDPSGNHVASSRDQKDEEAKQVARVEEVYTESIAI